MLVTYVTDRSGRKTDRDEFRVIVPCYFNRLTSTKLTFAVVSNFHIVMRFRIIW